MKVSGMRGIFTLAFDHADFKPERRQLIASPDRSSATTVHGEESHKRRKTAASRAVTSTLFQARNTPQNRR